MKIRATIRTTLLATGLVATFLFMAVPSFSQGCSMCYSTAKATSKEGQRAIGKGVIVLIIPPVGFMTLGLALAFRYGKKRDLETSR